MKPSKRNERNALAKAEKRQGKAPVVSKYAAKIQEQLRNGEKTYYEVYPYR